jgi:hydrogenase nickel incorporation protein HypB
MSSPGAGKTSLLERTVADLGWRHTVCVIEGDQETSFDADRIRRAGARAVQVNTGAGCHLDAAMVHRALHDLDPPAGSLLFVENVGNLVCPALFDLGERAKVVVVSVTEGDDKPLKYPQMFGVADLVVVNKTDLLPYVDFDLDRLEEQARALRPGVEVLPLSVRTGENVQHWYAFLEDVIRGGAAHGARVGT